MSDFSPKPAVRVNTPAFIALAGPSGSGKTRSALELATGLAGDGQILLGDTEGNRALHYADLYRFDHVEFSPPYTPERCAKLIDLAEGKGYAVLIIDSASDEYEGEGGLQEIRDATNDEFWARTKARHKHHLVNRIRRARLHTIWCLRAEERVRIAKEGGRTVVEHIGWQPICEKRFLYEMQSSFRFEPGERAGMPIAIKLYDIHASFFPPDKQITREAGRALAAWAAGAKEVMRNKSFRQATDNNSASVKAGADTPDLSLLIAEGDRAAAESMQSLEFWWTKQITKGQQRALGRGRLEAWKKTAAPLSPLDAG